MAPLARLGLAVYGVDVQPHMVRDTVRAASAAGWRLRGWCADLEQPAVPAHSFELIVVTRYLQRNLFRVLSDALVPGGVLLYETFTTRQRLNGRGPTSPDHLLEPDELRNAFAWLEPLWYEETSSPDALARLAARKP